MSRSKLGKPSMEGGEVIQQGMSMLDKVRQVEEELDAALNHSAHSRAVLFGEGEAGEAKGQAPRASSIGAVLHDVLEKACRLRGELERTAGYLHPTQNKLGVSQGGKNAQLL